MVISI